MLLMYACVSVCVCFCYVEDRSWSLEVRDSGYYVLREAQGRHTAQLDYLDIYFIMFTEGVVTNS